MCKFPNFKPSFLTVVHCRCSKCYSAPARKRVRKRTPALGLLSLPEEVLLCVLQCLSAEDLLSVRAVSKHTVRLLQYLWHACARSSLLCSGVRHLVTTWSVSCLFCWGTNSFGCCYRFTPSCVTLLTTTLVYGPGSASGTHGHPPPPYGYLKGIVSFVRTPNLLMYCFSSSWELT